MYIVHMQVEYSFTRPDDNCDLHGYVTNYGLLDGVGVCTYYSYSNTVGDLMKILGALYKIRCVHGRGVAIQLAPPPWAQWSTCTFPMY